MIFGADERHPELMQQVLFGSVCVTDQAIKNK